MSSPSAISNITRRRGSVRRSPYVRIATRLDGTRKKIRLYIIWESAIQRCHNPKQTSYYRYGGKGVRVCDEWRKSYDAFRAWAVSHGYRKSLTLDRVDARGSYEPTNCRWLTPAEQIYTSDQTQKITFNGETLPGPIWAKRIGIHPQVLRGRLNHGWSIEHALTTPKGKLRAGIQHQKRGRKPKQGTTTKES